MKTFTIGFTKKTAEQFFSIIKKNNISQVIDVRLNTSSQLAGFAKKNDLNYFLKELCKTDYIHVPDLTPTKPMLDAYKNKVITWDDYAEQFINLITQRNIERTVNKSLLNNACLLCSEHQPHQCHRRLVVEYLNKHLDASIEVVHLL